MVINMEKQLIISVGREYGSGGHEIAQRLAELYGLPLYDHNLLDDYAAERGLDVKHLKEYDESHRNPLMYRTVRGMNSSPEHNVAQIQFDFLKQKADAGESFVVVGRCSNYILREYEGLVSVFVLGDLGVKLERIEQIYHLNLKEAADLLEIKDKKRKKYHNSHCPVKWGDSRGYHISVNSSKLGVEGTAQILKQYIDARRNEA